MLYRFTDGLCEKMSRKKNSGFNFVTFKCSCVLKNKIKTAVLYIYVQCTCMLKKGADFDFQSHHGIQHVLFTHFAVLIPLRISI